jgi:hypothetical protein
VQGYTVLVGVDEDELIREACKYTATHVVVLTTATEFINSYTWQEYAEQYCQDHDFAIAGHILDRGDAYYEIHEQCYILNLSMYNKLGSPDVGQIEWNSPHSQLNPIRSPNNIHDNYTPLWIKPGISADNYQHRAHGWNLFRLALEADLPILVFDDVLRNNKIHYYPEYPDSYNTQINYVSKRANFCSGWAVYPYNSEYPHSVNLDTLDQFITPAAGINWMLQLATMNFHADTIVKFYDYSYPTLSFIRHLVENWNGIDYEQFVNMYLKENFSWIANSNDIPICGNYQNFNIDQDMWNNIKNLRFEYYWQNLLDSETDLQWIDNTPNTFINCSNIFNYIGTASNYSIRQRLQAENYFIKSLKDKIPKGYLLITRRAASGFIENTNALLQQISTVKQYQINELIRPTWHQNKDWTI